MFKNRLPPSPLEDWSGNPIAIDRELLIKRDDLLPFTLAGNKVRKLNYELAGVDIPASTVVTVGAVTSNHCRTTAMFAARNGGHAHLILHGNTTSQSAKLTLAMLSRLGATWEVVDSTEIPVAIAAARKSQRKPVHFIAGGCHTPAGVEAYVDAVHELADQLENPPDWIVLASGTGATQAGIIAGCHAIGWHCTRVLGVSVARGSARGKEAVREALSWRGLQELDIHFSSDYRANGYGLINDRVRRTRDLGWRNGLPLDATYTAKAFSALTDEEGPVSPSARVIFWHTGGLNTQMMMDVDSLLQ